MYDHNDNFKSFIIDAICFVEFNLPVCIVNIIKQVNYFSIVSLLTKVLYLKVLFSTVTLNKLVVILNVHICLYFLSFFRFNFFGFLHNRSDWKKGKFQSNLDHSRMSHNLDQLIN